MKKFWNYIGGALLIISLYNPNIYCMYFHYDETEPSGSSSAITSWGIGTHIGAKAASEIKAGVEAFAQSITTISTQLGVVSANLQTIVGTLTTQLGITSTQLQQSIGLLNTTISQGITINSSVTIPVQTQHFIRDIAIGLPLFCAGIYLIIRVPSRQYDTAWEKTIGVAFICIGAYMLYNCGAI